jgi:Inner membrane protein YgaP-like, transmembrane domain
MPAEPNIGGIARLSTVVAGAAMAGWALWGADPGWTQWSWLALGGVFLVLGLIGYSPVNAFFLKKTPKAN